MEWQSQIIDLREQNDEKSREVGSNKFIRNQIYFTTQFLWTLYQKGDLYFCANLPFDTKCETANMELEVWSGMEF